MQDNTMQLSDGRTLGFADYGSPDATPVILNHGTPGSRVLGLDDDPMLAHFGIRVIAPERPGYGLSDPQPNRAIRDWAADIAELADRLGLGRFHVAGESGGGPYVLACAYAMPTRVISASLIGSACPPEILKLTSDMAMANRLGFFFARHSPFLMKRASNAFARGMHKYPDKVMQRLTSQLCEWDKRVIEESTEHTGDVLMLHFQEAFRQGGDPHYVESLLVARPWGFAYTKIEVPVFLWHGECDNLVPIAPARELAKLIPGCETHYLPDAGHMLLESQDVGADIVSRLLSSGQMGPESALIPGRASRRPTSGSS
jgi:pimeloyl-ACP methyl ester carboxylesterase